jgi:hypothetical protein
MFKRQKLAQGNKNCNCKIKEDKCDQSHKIKHTQQTQNSCIHYCLHIQMVEKIQQDIQLAILPTFYNDPIEDKISATERLLN